MFRPEDPVVVDTSQYELLPPGIVSKSPGVVLAVTWRSSQLCYDVTVRLPLGATIDLSVPAEKVGPPETS
jgi:hypothetical protein